MKPCRSKESAVLSSAQERVVIEIRRLHAQAKPLNISAVRDHSPRLLDRVYTVKPFWGWKRALVAVGLSYDTIHIRWKNKVLCRECGVRRRSLVKHLLHHHGMSSESYRKRHPGAQVVSIEHVYRWRGLHDLRQAGDSNVIIPHWEPNWTPEYVLDRLDELNRRGVLLNPARIEREETSLYMAARKYFKNWDTALRLIGLLPDRVRLVARKTHWTARDVIGALRQRMKAGQVLNWTAVMSQHRSLGAAARKHFGSYDRALKSAGLDPNKIRKLPVPNGLYKSKVDVIAEIRRRRLFERPLNYVSVVKGEHKNIALYQKARRLFGSWQAAIKAAGLTYGDVAVRHLRDWTGPDIKKALAQRARDGLPLMAKAVRNDSRRQIGLYGAAMRIFGNWNAALRAAGIDPKEAYGIRSKYPKRSDVLNAIREWYIRNDAARQGPCHIGVAPNRALRMRAWRLFGPWPKAVAAAGLVYRPQQRRGRVPRYPTREAVIAEIKRRREARLPLNAAALRAGPAKDRQLWKAGLSMFGLWRKALIKAGINNSGQ